MSERPGTSRSFAEQVAAHAPLLRAYVRLNVDGWLRRHVSDTDIVQSVCKDLLAGAPPNFAGDAEGFRAWLWTVTRNKVRDRVRYLRQEKRDHRRDTPLQHDDGGEVVGLYASIASPSQEAIAGELAVRVERTFETMSREDRELVTLSRVVGLSNRDIAEQFGLTPANVSMRIHRALFAFTEKWKRAERASDRDPPG